MPWLEAVAGWRQRPSGASLTPPHSCNEPPHPPKQGENPAYVWVPLGKPARRRGKVVQGVADEELSELQVGWLSRGCAVRCEGREAWLGG